MIEIELYPIFNEKIMIATFNLFIYYRYAFKVKKVRNESRRIRNKIIHDLQQRPVLSWGRGNTNLNEFFGQLVG
jgi:hypothetical protein